MRDALWLSRVEDQEGTQTRTRQLPTSLGRDVGVNLGCLNFVGIVQFWVIAQSRTADSSCCCYPVKVARMRVYWEWDACMHSKLYTGYLEVGQLKLFLLCCSCCCFDPSWSWAIVVANGAAVSANQVQMTSEHRQRPGLFQHSITTTQQQRSFSAIPLAQCLALN